VRNRSDQGRIQAWTTAGYKIIVIRHRMRLQAFKEQKFTGLSAYRPIKMKYSDMKRILGDSDGET
jgi:hypothetical protein